MKIFRGSKVYEVSNSREAYEVMFEIARRTTGTFPGCSCPVSGFYVDVEHPVFPGMYPVMGCMDDKRYAETDSTNIFD